jgi:hypothetical protein
MLLVFLPVNTLMRFTSSLPELEEKLRIRKGYRFRALAGYQDQATEVCNVAINREQFSSCILVDAFLLKDYFTNIATDSKNKIPERTTFYIAAPDKGKHYEGNGNAHMVLRDKEIQHEYRVKEGDGGFDWFMSGLPEIISFAGKKFHK